jgi:hypothetical protein
MFKKYGPNKYLSYLYFIIPIILSCFLITPENDLWFLLSIGRYIVSKKIPYTDILSMHTSFSFVSQQWLTATIFYLVYKVFLGIGIHFLLIIINSFILYFLYKICLIKSNGKVFISVLISSFIDILLECTFITPRPQVFTILIITILIYILEVIHKNNNSKLIYLIPILSLFQINIQGAMWLCLFILILPYLVEDIYYYFKNKNKFIFKLLLIVLISFLVGFINPYGISLITYPFRSYGISYINEIVKEMSSFNLTGQMFIKLYSYLLLFLFILISTIIFTSKNKLKIHEYFLFLGTLYMALINMRNHFIFYICGVSVIASFINIKDSKSSYKPKLLYLILLLIIIFSITYNIYNNNYTYTNKNDIFVKYLDKNASKDIKIFTDYDDGNYLEYCGYKPYIDTRAEVFLKVNNKKEDVFIEYYNLISGNLDYNEFLNKYNFDYLIVNKGNNFYKYLKNNSSYELIITSNDRGLFKLTS